MADLPRPPIPSTGNPRSPTDHFDPPYRHGQSKTNPGEVSTNKRTRQIIQANRGRIHCIGLEIQGERPRGTIREDDGTRVDRGRPHSDSTAALAATYHIGVDVLANAVSVTLGPKGELSLCV